MKKKFILPLIGIALVACGGNPGSTPASEAEKPSTPAAEEPSTPKAEDPSTPAAAATPLEITLDKITGLRELVDANETTYFKDEVIYTIDNVSWKTSGNGTFGGAISKYAPIYYEYNAMQLKNKEGNIGYTFNTTAMTGYKTVTIDFINTYKTQEANYFPTVYAGTTENPTTPVTANEASVTGTDTGKTQESNSKTYSVYTYTTTYTLPADATFFKFAAGTKATYITKITIA